MKAPSEIYVSPHFTLEEVVYSKKAIDINVNNTPNTEDLITCVRTAVGMERVRDLLSKPIHVNSWYRCAEVNRALGSKETSQHRLGEAVDFICQEFGSPLQICKKIISAKNIIPFDQLILEHTWVHISFSILNGKPRGQVLSLLASGEYSSGLTDKYGKPY